MLEGNVLLERLKIENSPGFIQLTTSDDSVSNSDNDTIKSTRISELNLNEGINNSSTQTNYNGKMKSDKCLLHGLKPYDQLSDREKQRLKERKTRTVIRLKQEMRRYGINRSISIGKDDLVNKLNDTGFVGHRRRENSSCSVGSLDSVDDLSSSFEEEEDFEKDLESWYQSGCAEYYLEEDKSNWDLVRNYMEMEERIEELQKSLNQTRLRGEFTGRTFDVAAEMEKIRVFREEIEILTAENELLQTENEKLRLRLSSQTKLE